MGGLSLEVSIVQLTLLVVVEVCRISCAALFTVIEIRVSAPL
jgi:hypothetical protein